MEIKKNKKIKPFIDYVQSDPKLNKKLKIIIIVLVILILFSTCAFSKAKSNSGMVKVPEEVSLSDNDAVFDVIIAGKLENNEKISIIVDKDNYLDCGKEGKVKLNVSLSNYYLTNENSHSTITIKHDDIPEGTWDGSIKLTFVKGKKKTVKTVNITSNISHKEIRKVEEDEQKNKDSKEEKKEDVIVREEKVMYSYRKVVSWDESNYLLEKPNGDFIEKTQYTKEYAQFSNSNFSTSIPSDGFYKEATQYGCNTRTKQEVDTPVTTSHSETYNNVGTCPGDCIGGTAHPYINEQGSDACECTINRTTTTYTHSINYGNWEEKTDAWRFDSPYTASDVIEPKERKVYLTPTGWNQSNEWSFEEPSKNNETRVTSRTVYLLPGAYSEESPCQDDKPTAEHIKITEHKFYRIVKNGIPGEWQEEKTDK